MPFLEIQGIPFPVRPGSFSQRDGRTGDVYGRSVNGSLIEARGGQFREWSFDSPPIRRDEALAWKRLIDGMGQGWSFFAALASSSLGRFSQAGILDTKVGTPTIRTATPAPRHGGAYLQINSGGAFGFDPRHRVGIHRRQIDGGEATAIGWSPIVDGWTIIFWRYAGTSWGHYVARGSVIAPIGGGGAPPGVTQYFNGGGLFSMGHYISIDVDTAAIYGKNASGTNAITYYDDFVFYPFNMPAAWVAPLYAFHSAHPLGKPPFVAVRGDALGDTVPVQCVGFVESMDNVQGRHKDATAWESNLYTLRVRLAEA
jgi:hypothetical protein